MKRFRLNFFELVTVGSVLAGGFSVARALPTVTLRPDEPASKDAWTYQFFPTTDMNELYFAILPAGNTGTNSSHSQQSFIQFDLSSIAMPAAKVQSATIDLHVIPSESTGFGVSPSPVYNLDVTLNPATRDWSEALNWNGRPTLAAASTTVTFNGSQTNNWASFNATNLVKNWLTTPASNFGVGVVADHEVRDADQTAVIAMFESASSSNKPSLTITFTPTPGDANLDDKVTLRDLYALASNWQRTGDADWFSGDFNGDGDVDASDLGILANNWQAGVAGAAMSSSEFLETSARLGLPLTVPEPMSGWLCAMGCAALQLSRKPRGRR